MRTPILVQVVLFLLVLGGLLGTADAQPVELRPMPASTPRIEVAPISTGGSLVTIQKPIKIDGPSLTNQNISHDHLRTAIPNLPDDARIIKLRTSDKPEESRVLFRHDASSWVPAPPTVQPLAEPPPQPPVLWLATAGWKKDYRLITQLVPSDSGQNSWGWPEVGPFAVSTASNLAALKGLLDSSPQLVIINRQGNLLPRAWFDLIRDSGRPYVIVTPESPTKDFLGVRSAAGLGDRPVRANSVRVLNALPKLEGWLSGYWELHRMNLQLGQRDAWERLLSTINSQSLPVQMTEASKDSVQEELLYGNNDVVFVIALNDGHLIYLPGSSGPISFDDIRKLRRSEAPNRTIVLVTCNGGTLNVSPRSLTDILLENKLAKTVFSSQNDVDANDVPALLHDLLVKGKDIRDTLIKHGYFQFVMRLLRVNPDV